MFNKGYIDNFNKKINMHLTVIRSIHVFSLVNISDISIDCLRNVCVCVYGGLFFVLATDKIRQKLEN